ncbi:MAG: polyprenyl synthetase family protein [Candidatus Thermoplasmatota archaeon]|nr:polyprenyl synthetase family protein [Candidatus Thermoplasmatota archaeon]MCL5730622.1 polyprenyl synthetase family protein [Candidatus Thermoplasmatota archaeon]
MEEWEDYVKALREEVNLHLREFLDRKAGESQDTLIRKVSGMIREYSLRGGKRIRPILVLLGCDLFRHHTAEIAKASISIEISQSYFLIQDDIIDQSDTRRGFPSFHIQVWRDIFNSDPSKRRIAESVGIIASDLSESYSHEAMLEAGLPDDIALKGDRLLSEIFEVTGQGELIDVFSSENESFSEADLMRVHLWKTAKYTVEGPLVLGATISGRAKTLQNLSRFGNLLGIAFQIQDDILGVFGDDKKTGKPIKSDINEGKKTLLVLKAMELGSPEEASFISRAIRSGNISDDDFTRVKAIMERTGSLDYSRRLAATLVKKSKDYLSRVEGDAKIKRIIEGFSDYLINRES